MAQLDNETLGKLTEALSGDIELYNGVLNHIQQDNDQINQLTAQNEDATKRLTETEARGQGYLTQISNLLSRIPVGDTSPNQSTESKVEDILNEPW